MYNSVFKLSFYTNLSTDNLQCIYISNNKYINITNRYKLESNLNWNWIDSLNLSIPSPNTQNIKTQTCWWQKVRRKLRCSQRYFLLFRGRHYLHISNPRMHLAEVNQDDVWSREKCRLYCKYVGDISLKSISYELFYPIFTNCFCASSIQTRHLRVSVTVRILSLKVTSKFREQSCVLYSEFLISCCSSESVRCVELSWRVCYWWKELKQKHFDFNVHCYTCPCPLV